MSFIHTRTTARTLMGFLAAISLLLSLFAIASPALAGGNDESGEASLNIRKLVEGTNTRLPGAVFEIEGMEGTFVTDENGQICITGLPKDSEWLVREIQAPPGYEIVEPAEQWVEVDDDGDCDSADAKFYNRPVSESSPSISPSVEASVSPSVEQSTESSASPTGDVEGGSPTPGGGTVPDTAFGSSSIPAWPFAVLALMSLGGLLYLRLSAEPRRR